jgi:plasmid stabilization system protein ParE
MRVEYHPSAVDDLNAAVAWHEQQKLGLGDDLRPEVYAAISLIRERPRQYPVAQSGLRRCLVRRFPYSVLFRLLDNTAIRVLVIRHHRRRTGYGANRR